MQGSQQQQQQPQGEQGRGRRHPHRPHPRCQVSVVGYCMSRLCASPPPHTPHPHTPTHTFVCDFVGCVCEKGLVSTSGVQDEKPIYMAHPAPVTV
jgi:hypothetical protein